MKNSQFARSLLGDFSNLSLKKESLSKIEGTAKLSIQLSDGHGNVVFDLFIETTFLPLIALCLIFENFLSFQVSMDQSHLTPGGYLPCLHTGVCMPCFSGSEIHLKAIFLGLKFANMNFSFFFGGGGGKNFQQLPFSLGSVM